jgi:hypothetical protein
MSENEVIRKLEEEIENISRFPDENPHSVIRVSFGGELLFANSSARSALDQTALIIKILDEGTSC